MLDLFVRSKREVLDSFVRRIEKEYKNVIISGYTDGYVEDKEKVMRQITELDLDFGVCRIRRSSAGTFDS